jgi:Flp pilus assembly protein TadD
MVSRKTVRLSDEDQKNSMNTNRLQCVHPSARPCACRINACLPILLTFSLLVFAGCKSGFGDQFSWSNPFKSTKTAEKSPPQDKSKSVAKKDSKRTFDFDEELIRARALEKAGKYEEARAVYQRLIVEFPDRYEGYHRLAVVADRQKRYREAQGLYEEAIRLERNNPDLFNDLGYCFFLQGQLDKAERSLLKAVAMSPSKPRYRNNLGMVYGHQRRYEEAMDQFRRAGSEADSQYNLAFVRASQNDFDEAKACFHRALAADPTFEPARRALDSFRKAEDDPTGVYDNNPVVQNGTYWVPYREDGAPGTDGATQTASHNVATARDAGASVLRNNDAVVRQMHTSAQSPLQRARVDTATRVQQGYSE